MRLALAEAARCAATDDVPVGAVIVRGHGTDQELVAAGHNVREADNDPLGHAELLAIRAAARKLDDWQLTDCTLIVTLEPCTMCAGALVASRVRRCVYGAADPKAGAVGSLWDVVRDRRLNHRPEVLSGVLADESASLLAAFFAGRRAGSAPSGKFSSGGVA